MRTTCFLIVAILFLGIGVAQAFEKPSVLVLAGTPLNRLIDDTYKEKMESEGYLLDSHQFRGLTWDRMSKFNVLVIARVPYANNETEYGYFKATFPLLKRFLKEGGGILWLHDPFYMQVHVAMNTFTKDYGLEMMDEFITDPEPRHRFKQKMFRQQDFFTTTQISQHPTTEGIDKIAVPDYWYNARSFKTDDRWRVLITGEESAYSVDYYTKQKTFETKPPLFAATDQDNARMAVFSVMSTWTVQAGYHRIWEGIVLDRGNAYHLLRNTYDWLGAKSLASGSLGGYKGESADGVSAEQCYYNIYPMNRQLAQKSVFSGLVGARSDIAGGINTVAEMCKAARKAGLNFLVFTEPMAQMDKVKWRKLSDECIRESWGSFVALPGFEYIEPDGSTRICFNNLEWVFEGVLDDNGFFRHPGHPLFDFNWPTVAYVDSHHPDPSPYAYHEWKFYNAFGLFTYDRGKLIDDSADRFATFARDYYALAPMAYHKVYSVDDLRQAAESGTYKTYVLAPSIKEVPQAMGAKNEPFRYFGKSTFVSSGPKINDFRLIGDGWTIDPWECYFLWLGGQKARMRIDVSSDTHLTDVVVYRGGEEYWHFRPNTQNFNRELDYVFEQSGDLRIEVRDANGRNAYSYVLMTRHNNWWCQMCTDMQNTIQNGLHPVDKGGFPFRDGRMIMYGGMGNQVTGISARILSPTATGEIIPDGLDAIYGGFTLDTGVTMCIDDKRVSPRQSVHSFSHVTGSVGIMDSFGVTGPENSAASDFRFVTRNTASPCRPDSYGIVEVEQRVTFLRDFTVSDTVDELPITLLSLSGNKDLYPIVSYNSNGKIERLDRKNLQGPIIGRLDKFGGACIYPQFWGSGCVFAIDGQEYDLRITDDVISIGLNQPGREFKKGETLTARFLVVRESGRDPNDEGMRALMSNYGVGSPPAYEITTSGELKQDYYPEINVSKYGAETSISKADLANDLFLRVKGVDSDWSVGCYDADEKKLSLIGSFEGMSYVPVDTRHARRLYVGNVLTCDSTNVRLTLVEWGPSNVTFQAHNLSNKPISTAVQSAGSKAGLVKFSRKLSLEPGELKVVAIK